MKSVARNLNISHLGGSLYLYLIDHLLEDIVWFCKCVNFYSKCWCSNCIKRKSRKYLLSYYLFIFVWRFLHISIKKNINQRLQFLHWTVLINSLWNWTEPSSCGYYQGESKVVHKEDLLFETFSICLLHYNKQTPTKIKQKLKSQQSWNHDQYYLISVDAGSWLSTSLWQRLKVKMNILNIFELFQNQLSTS